MNKKEHFFTAWKEADWYARTFYIFLMIAAVEGTVSLGALALYILRDLLKVWG